MTNAVDTVINTAAAVPGQAWDALSKALSDLIVAVVTIVKWCIYFVV